MTARLVLLDADVIIEAFRHGIWDQIVTKVQVHIPRPVLGQANFYRDALPGQYRRIDLRPDVEAGRVKVLDTTDEALEVVTDTCGRWLDVHDGEKHPLAALSSLSGEYRFCTGDKAAIQALVLLDMTDRAISMEQMLGDYGIGRREPLPGQFTEQYMKKWLRLGAVLKAGKVTL